MWTGEIEVEDMGGILLATTLGYVRGLIYVESKLVLVISTDYLETTPSRMTREGWHGIPYGWTEFKTCLILTLENQAGHEPTLPDTTIPILSAVRNGRSS